MPHNAKVDLDARIAHRRAQCQRARAPLALLKLSLQDAGDWHERVGAAAVSSLVGELGQRLLRRVRDTDEVVALGDGGYAVLLPGAASADADGVAARLQEALTAPYRIGLLLLSPGLAVERLHWPADAAASAPRAGPAAQGDGVESPVPSAPSPPVPSVPSVPSAPASAWTARPPALGR
jgi:GGDEF domain-containing protein